MSMQLIGLIRYCRYPVAAKAFNILQGFSILEFLYVPNVFLNAFPIIYSEVTYPIMSFVNINHNFIVNIGSELIIFLALQLPIIVLLIWKREAVVQRVKKI